jgi:serine/threonine-protein kinase
VEGEALIKQLNRDGPMTGDKMAQVGVQVSSGLAYLHSRGIIHRDVKPENILIGTSGDAKLADLGLAKNVGGSASGSSTIGGKMLGTPSYMSPEQITDARKVDFRTDVYSAGATLYRMVTGQPPFLPGPPLEVARRVLTEEPERADKVNLTLGEGLGDVIAKSMSKDANQRYQSVEELMASLKPFAG